MSEPRKLSEETRAKMSAAKKGKPAHNKGKKTGKPGWNKGIPMNEETKAKLSATNKGRVFTDEWRAKLSAAHKGRSASNNGKPPKPIMTPYGPFDSVKDCAQYCNVAAITIYKRIQLKPDQYYFVKKEE